MSSRELLRAAARRGGPFFVGGMTLSLVGFVGYVRGGMGPHSGALVAVIGTLWITIGLLGVAFLLSVLAGKKEAAAAFGVGALGFIVGFVCGEALWVVLETLGLVHWGSLG